MLIQARYRSFPAPTPVDVASPQPCVKWTNQFAWTAQNPNDYSVTPGGPGAIFDSVTTSDFSIVTDDFNLQSVLYSGINPKKIYLAVLLTLQITGLATLGKEVCALLKANSTVFGTIGPIEGDVVPLPAATGTLSALLTAIYTITPGENLDVRYSWLQKDGAEIATLDFTAIAATEIWAAT